MLLSVFVIYLSVPVPSCAKASKNRERGLLGTLAALSHRDMPDRGWSVLMGVLSAIAGIIVLAYPGLTLVGLAVILGIWLLVFGILEIIAAFRLRKLAETGAVHTVDA